MSATLIESASPDRTRLLARAQRGNAEAYGELCLILENRLLRHAMILCDDVSLAEDLTQETLVEAWKCLARYNGQCQFFTWLCAILQNRYRSHRRRKQLLSFFGFEPPAGEAALAALDQPRDKSASPDQAVQSQEQAALVRKCVQALPPKQQQVVYLRFFADDSLEGIASAVGCSMGTVKSRLFYALHKLRAMPELREGEKSINQKMDAL